MAGSRRGAGEGSVYKEEKSGLWCATVEVPTEGGKRRRVSRRARTKKEALTKIDAVKAQVAAHLPVPDQRQTLKAWLAWWLDNEAGTKAKASTVAGYRTMCDAYIIPAIGKKRLAQLTPRDVQGMLRGMEKAGLAGWTRRQARAVLSRALNVAMRHELVGRNVALLVDPPSVAPPPKDAMTGAEASRLLAVVKDDRFGPLVELLLGLGLRRGEALALQWSNVNLKSRTLRIAGTLKRSADKSVGLYIDTPKTAASTRTLPLSQHDVRVLKMHRRRQNEERLVAGSGWEDRGFVFTMENGRPVDPRFAGKWWHQQLKAAKLRDRPMHSTRRTAVTLMAEAGVPLEVVASLVGHSTIRMTAETYNEVRPRAQADALETLRNHVTRSAR
jgi:integrase